MRLPRFFHRPPSDDELSEELRCHLEMRADQYIAAGIPPSEAREKARRVFGNLGLTLERTRAVNVSAWLESFVADLRYAIRALRRNPAFTLAALLALAIGIGATTAVFSVVDRAMFRSLPYPDPNRLYWTGMNIRGLMEEILTGVLYPSWIQQQKVFEQMAAFSGVSDCVLTTGQEPVRVPCTSVTASFLPVLRIHPVMGRNFRAEEDRPGGAPVVLLSWGVWQRSFGGDPALVGRSIILSGQVRTVLGILPRDFEFPTLAQVGVLTPLALNDTQANIAQHGTRILRVVGRLKPGISAVQARAGLELVFEAFRNTIPVGEYRKRLSLAFVSFQDRQVRDIRTAFLVLLAAVASVLLIACANVANLLLARAAARRQETAVRLAIGAGRLRLFRQWLTESAVLALAGGFGGALLGYFLLKLLIALAPEGIPRLGQAALDGRVLLFALGISLATGLLFGLAPALQLRQVSIHGAAHPNTLTASSWTSHGLIVLQLSISLVLLTSAGLLARSLWHLERVQTGFHAEHVLVTPYHAPYEMAGQLRRQAAFYNEAIERLGRLPGIRAVAVADALPLTSSGGSGMLTVEGHAPPQAGDPASMAGWRAVTPGYFSALGVQLLSGRPFNERDTVEAPLVVIVNQALVRRFFPNEDPLEKHIDGGGARPWRTIVGVVADVKNSGLREPAHPEFWRPVSQFPFEIQPYLIVRTALDLGLAGPLLRAELRRLNPTQPLEIQSMEERVDLQLQRPRFQTLLLLLLAVIALLLSLLGIYGVMSYLVVQRTREIGIRMALGATPARVRRFVVGRTMSLAALGIAVGLVGSWAAGASLASLLFEVTSHDVLTFATVAPFLLAVSFLASYLPARRASRIDPLAALRHE